MSYKVLSKRGDWIVQVQRGGIRRTKRGTTGGEAEAKLAETMLLAEMEQDLRREEAARLLGVDPVAAGITPAKPLPTLREFFETRWIEHAKVVQNQTTRRASARPSNIYCITWAIKRSTSSFAGAKSTRSSRCSRRTGRSPLR